MVLFIFLEKKTEPRKGKAFYLVTESLAESELRLKSSDLKAHAQSPYAVSFLS